jgi:hypothetical protein
MVPNLQWAAWVYGSKLPVIRPALVWPAQTQGKLTVYLGKADRDNPAALQLLEAILGPKALALTPEQVVHAQVLQPVDPVQLGPQQTPVGLFFGKADWLGPEGGAQLPGNRTCFVVASLTEMTVDDNAKKAAWRVMQMFKAQLG